jgi:hypothetical protein
MENKHPIITIHGKFGFGLVGKTILRLLYRTSDKTLGTKDLMRILRPEQVDGEQEQKAYEEIQAGVEKLLGARLVTGKWVVESERVFFDKLHLTSKGLIEAIQMRNRERDGEEVDFIIMDVPRPRRDKVLPS